MPIVLAPVVVAKSGGPLLETDAVEAVRTLLLPQAHLIMPNLPEAAVLLGEDLFDGVEQMHHRLEPLLALGSTWVLLKGGHLQGCTSLDILYGETTIALPAERVSRKKRPRYGVHPRGGHRCAADSTAPSPAPAWQRSTSPRRSGGPMISPQVPGMARRTISMRCGAIRRYQTTRPTRATPKKRNDFMTHTFTTELREQNHQAWEESITHRFVRELLDGSIDDAVMAGYLVQDYRFLDSFLVLLGSAVATADTLDARLRLSRFIGAIAGDENTYFLRSFDALGVTETRRRQVPDTEPTAAFKALMREAAETREYAAILAVLLVAEWLYHDWAVTAPSPLPPNFVHAEWVTLHNYPEFVEFVAFLRTELDRVGPAHRSVVEDFFGRAVAVELAFFDASYNYPLEGLK